MSGPATDIQLSGSPVPLADRMEIFPSNPLPALNVGHAKAYAARARGETKASCYALVCEAGLPVRGADFASFLAIDNPNLTRFRDQGIVEWPLTGRREQVVVFIRPVGARLDAVYTTPQKPMEDEELVRFFIRPMYTLLRDIVSRGAAHGNIHLGNLYQGGAEVQAGDAVSCPPSYAMPALYCSIERGQCHPAGRGNPNSADDIYAMGVSALILALGQNPWARMSDADIVAMKIDKGSFFGLLGDQRIKGSLVELFRGMLDDNPFRRWTLSDLDMWLNGRRPPPRQNEEDGKGVRGLTINGTMYHNLRGVAHALVQDPFIGASVIENGEVEKWILHSLNNEKLAATLKRSVAGFAGRAGMHDMVVARALLTIDPTGPLRFRGIAAMPSGLGYLLATTMIQGGQLQTIGELMASNLPSLWVDAQEEGRADHIQTQQLLEHAKALGDKRGLGFGLERAVYEMLPALPCLSPVIRNYSCRTLHDVLFYLNQSLGRASGEVIDRHLMGYIFAREKKIPPPTVLANANNNDNVQRMVAILRVLAEVQNRHGPDKLNNLTNWMVTQLEPATRRFFEKATQDKARAQLQAAAKDGLLAPLVSAVDDGTRVDRDRTEFENARYYYAKATQEIAELQLDIEQRKLVEIRVGQPIASGIAAIVGFIAIGFVILLTVLGVGV